MKSIPLTQDKFALVDDVDHEALLEFTWCASEIARTFYAITYIGTGRKDNRLLSMHRMLMQPQPGFDVHHIDGNGLNNQRANLRVITRSEHIFFNPPRSSTGYKGVVFCVNRQRKKEYRFYLAQMFYRGERVLYTCHQTPEEAARAYDAKVRELVGLHAYLNFPSDAGKVRDAANGE